MELSGTEKSDLGQSIPDIWSHPTERSMVDNRSGAPKSSLVSVQAVIYCLGTCFFSLCVCVCVCVRARLRARVKVARLDS